MRTDADHLARVRDPAIKLLLSHTATLTEWCSRPRGPLDNRFRASARPDQRRSRSSGIKLEERAVPGVCRRASLHQTPSRPAGYLGQLLWAGPQNRVPRIGQALEANTPADLAGHTTGRPVGLLVSEMDRLVGAVGIEDRAHQGRVGVAHRSQGIVEADRLGWAEHHAEAVYGDAAVERQGTTGAQAALGR